RGLAERLAGRMRDLADRDAAERQLALAVAAGLVGDRADVAPAVATAGLRPLERDLVDVDLELLLGFGLRGLEQLECFVDLGRRPLERQVWLGGVLADARALGGLDLAWFDLDRVPRHRDVDFGDLVEADRRDLELRERRHGRAARAQEPRAARDL